MEDELGRAYSLAVIKRRLWYAPWCKKQSVSASTCFSFR